MIYMEEKNINSDIRTIYFAHNIQKYNTQREKDEEKLIKDIFITSLIINPNEWINKCDNESYIIEQRLHFIKYNCNMLVFSSLNNYVIDKNVYEEIKIALEYNKDVYFLAPNNEFIRFTSDFFNKISIIVEETKTNIEYAKILI